MKMTVKSNRPILFEAYLADWKNCLVTEREKATLILKPLHNFLEVQFRVQANLKDDFEFKACKSMIVNTSRFTTTLRTTQSTITKSRLLSLRSDQRTSTSRLLSLRSDPRNFIAPSIHGLLMNHLN